MRRPSSPSSAAHSPFAAALGDSENDLLASILGDIPDAILLVGERGRITYWNESAGLLFGLTHGRRARFSDLLSPASRERKTLQELWRLLEREGRIENCELQLIDADGRTIDALASQTAIRDERGRLIGYSAVVKDITGIKESERRIARRNAQLLALQGVAEAITELAGVSQLLERALDAALRVTSLSIGSVHLLDEEDESLRLAAQRGLSLRAAEMLALFESGEGVIGRVAVLGEMIVVTDAANDERIAKRDIADERIGALVSAPLMARGGVRGVLTLYHDRPRAFTEHERSVLDSVGRQVGLALEHARLYEEVTAARREWERTFDALADGVSVHATSGRIRRANRSLARMFGTTPEALVGVRCCELYHGSPKPRANCTIMRTATERIGQSVELRDRLHERVLRVTTDPVINAEGRVTGVVCTTRDVTDEKLIERRLIQQERISAIGEVAAGIAHEVGTPLNIISANVELLLRDSSLVESAREELEAIREQSQNIARLVRQLLDFSRDRKPSLAPVNINELIERTTGLLAHEFSRAGIVCELNLAPYVPTVEGDAAQLQQVFFNIINNAREAMEDADDAPNENEKSKSSNRQRHEKTKARRKLLTVTTDSALMPTETMKRPHVVISVRDTGRGIPPEALPHVFNPFFTANKEGGTGLGLAISHRIVQRHSGTLAIEQSDPTGTLVRIRLPLAQI